MSQTAFYSGALDNIFVERLRRNVKYEDVYLRGYASMAELMVGLAQYFAFYNAQRPHLALRYQTPNDDERPEEVSSTGQRRAAEEVETGTA